MARYDHLPLVRLPEQLERRKLPGGGGPPARDASSHSRKLRDELDDVVAEEKQRRTEAIDPSLILRVRMSGMTMEEDWESLGLTLLASDEDKTLVLFASDDDMAAFRQRLDAYARGTPEGQKNPSYAGFINRIEEIGVVEPRDRIGVRLRESGLVDTDDFDVDADYVLDVEIWDLGRREARERTLDAVEKVIVAGKGEVFDRYVGPSITMLRARLNGAVAVDLLTIKEIAELELPPQPDAETAEALDMSLGDIPPLDSVDEDAPVIGIIDSGVNAHPLLEDVYLGGVGAPETLGTVDDWGHGTRVAGIALFGDLRGQIEHGVFSRSARLASAKVVNERGDFDDRQLTPKQMREALSTLHERYGCRLFVLALGDRTRTFDGKKVGPWAATLDELARELDAVIVVAAGNRSPRGGTRLDQAVTEYPDYLLERANRFCEPAGALNVIAAGALAHGEGVGPEFDDTVHVRPITRALEPAPFTRVGPGIRGAIKPDVVDVGGTMVLDGLTQQLRKGEDLPTAGVLTLNHAFVKQLFASGSGTSYAAPLVAHKASRILTRFPTASANLVRALLISAADVPEAARAKLEHLGDTALTTVCGHGQVDAVKASFSDDHRVILYADDSLPIDHFAVFHVPIPEPFQTGGKRTIRVTLAYDPPVRHTRADYAGVKMSFRLVRGCEPDLIFDHFRKRAKEDGRFPELESRFNCALKPGPQQREKGVVQSADVSFSRDTDHYGDDYYLVVRCEGGWAAGLETEQRFAAVVELRHQAEVQLYERVRARARIRP